MTDQPLTSSPSELQKNSVMSTEESKDEGLDPSVQFRAAEYVRMSTEHQQYSTENQADKIREYASHRGIQIVKTYADAGKSGLNIGGRLALQQLIKDVESGAADFQIILVYDVSRWGRFQDADESAYYEYICTRARLPREDVGHTTKAAQFDVVSAESTTGGLAGPAGHHRRLQIGINMAKNDRGIVTGDPVTYQIPAPAGGVQMETFIPWTLIKRGVRRQVITPIDAPEHFQKEAVVERSARKHAKDSPLIRALGLAHYWQRLLDEGKYRSLTEIAAAEGMDRGQVSRMAQLTRLTPIVVQSCLSDSSGRPKLETLARACLTNTWADQSSLIPSEPQGRQ